MKIAIISDIHEDVVSLKKALQLIEQNKCDEIFFLGDVVGFANLFYDYETTKNANECIDLIRTNCKLSIVGNHDLYIARRFPDFFAKNNYPKNWYDLSYKEQQVISKNKVWLYQEEDDPELSPENMDFMKAIPQYEIMEIDKINYLFSHSIFPDISGVSKQFPSQKEDYLQHFNFMTNNNCLFSLTGHWHTGGFTLRYPKKFVHKDYKKIKLKIKTQIINCPAIARGKRQNGFVILDTVNFELSAIKI